MKSAHYILFLALTYSWQVHADAWSKIYQPKDKEAERICKLIDKMGTMEASDNCRNLKHNFEDKKQFEEVCSGLLIRKYSKEENYDLIESCHKNLDLMAQIKKEDPETSATNEIIATGAVADIRDDIPNLTISKSMTECTEEMPADQLCTTENIMSVETYESIKSHLPTPETSSSTHSAPKYSIAECKCLNQKIEKNYSFKKKTAKDIERDINAEKKKINDLIFKAASKRFLNQFANQVEDVNYYLTNNPKAIASDKNKANSQICTDSKAFIETLEKDCSKNGISKEVQEQRIENVLGVYGDFIDKKTTEDKFLHLTLDILIGNGKENTRYNYDLARSGATMLTPQVKIVDELTTELLKNPDLTMLLQKNIEDGEKPVDAIISILGNKKIPAALAIVKKITSPKYGLLEKNPTYHNLNIKAQTDSESDLRSLLYENFDKAMALHPGLKGLFRSSNLFEKLKSTADLNNSLIMNLESNHSLLGDYYSERCNKLKERFAKIICTKDSDYISRTPPKELNEYMNSGHVQANPEIKDALLCHAARGPEDEYIFKNLNITSRSGINKSDYYLRKESQKSDSNQAIVKSGYDKFLNSFKSGNSEVTSFIQQASSLGEKKKSSTTGMVSVGPLNENQSKKLSPTAIDSSKTVTDKSSESHMLPNNNFLSAPAPLQPYVSPSTQVYAANKQNEETSTNSRSSKHLLREFLADEKNKAEVDKLLSQTSDDDLQKLMKLKEEIALDQKKYQDLIQETEKAKLKAMEKNLIAMEKEIKAPVKPQLSEKKKEYQGPTYFQGGVQSGALSGNMVQRDYSSAAAPASESTSLGSGSSSSGSSNSMAARAPASKGESSSIASGSKGAAIIIESPTVRSNEQFAHEDLSKEVISYVNQAELDVQTLKNLKESGLVLKFKVLKDGIEIQKEVKVDYSTLTSEAKSVLDQKIAEQEKTLEYERLKRAHSYATLKLILGQKLKEQRVN